MTGGVTQINEAHISLQTLDGSLDESLHGSAESLLGYLDPSITYVN